MEMKLLFRKVDSKQFGAENSDTVIYFYNFKYMHFLFTRNID